MSFSQLFLDILIDFNKNFLLFWSNLDKIFKIKIK